jgi:ribosomal protein L7/L12
MSGSTGSYYSQQTIDAMLNSVKSRLEAIESQLATLSDHAGVPYERPLADVPEDVMALALDGKKLEAMKRYRELTNASADQAREFVAGL